MMGRGYVGAAGVGDFQVYHVGAGGV